MDGTQSQLFAWSEEEDRGESGENRGQSRQSKEDFRADRDTVGDLSEKRFDFSKNPRKKHKEKGKKKWVPKHRQLVKRKEFGKLIIGEKLDHMGKGRTSDDTSTSEEEGLISDFKTWRGEKGECSRHEAQRNKRDFINDGPDFNEPTFGLQKVNVSRSQSMDGPLKEFLEKVDKDAGRVAREDFQGFQILTRSQSMDGPLKDYIEELEQAFIRSKLKRDRPSQLVENQLVGSNIYQTAVSSDEKFNSDRSVSIVLETTDSSESLKTKEAQDKEEVSFSSISEVIPSRIKAQNIQRKRDDVFRKENWNEEEEVVKVSS
ncbi:hypothetical protein Q3G72_019908 [Acer saccharum]|nr:hypothetical protein Q3G72_019908 [Acer saccharum]